MKFNVEKNNRMTAYVWAISGYVLFSVHDNSVAQAFENGDIIRLPILGSVPAIRRPTNNEDPAHIHLKLDILPAL